MSITILVILAVLIRESTNFFQVSRLFIKHMIKEGVIEQDFVFYLVRMSDCGVNLAGVEVALKLMQRMREMQEQLEEMERRIDRVGESDMEDVIGDIIEDAEWNEI